MNSSFSTQVPDLQLAWDSTSLGAFKRCPRYYQYTIIQGWEPRRRSVDLEFGILVHTGFETYHKSRATGQDHQQALRVSLRRVLADSWDKVLGRPHLLDDPAKNRVSLVRALVWVLDSMHEAETSGLDSPKTIQLANGQAAAELSFRFDSGFQTATTNEPIVLCGHLDRIVEFAGKPYIEDTKTTKYQLDSHWLQQFSPDNQFSLYTLAGQTVWHQPVEGLLVSGIQIGATFVRGPRRALVPRPQPVIDEWLSGTARWLAWAEDCALKSDWPQDDKACGMYRGCEFRSICSKSPASRQTWLEAEFTKRVWDPLQAR